jgi:hypothetical protein
MYKQFRVVSDRETITEGVYRLSDNAFIPFDPANTDYQEYLKWLAEGNEPLPPDSQE